ncbi:MAG: hypothetical protein ACRBBR_00735 [Cellvibrionaceae bacterium]
MGVQVSFFTDGKGVVCPEGASMVSSYPDIDGERRIVAAVHLRIGSSSVDIHFNDEHEMIEFCEKHNFEYRDDREAKG